jgi:SAM-dependent methyltransferase
VLGKTWTRAIPQGCREAPAPFKYNGKYYLFTSGLTGCTANPADIAVADSILGPWKMQGNPCIGPEANTSFHSQSTFVIHAPGKSENCFIFMADRWNGNELQKSTFIWLPFCIQSNGSIQLAYIPKWNLSVFDNFDNTVDKPVAKVSSEKQLSWNEVSGAAYYKVFRNGLLISFSSGTSFNLPKEMAGKAFAYTVSASNLLGISSLPSDPIVVKWDKVDTTYLSDVEPESWSQGFGAPEKDRAINQSPINIANRIFKKGIGTHSPSIIVYNICGSYSRFTAWVGVDHYPVFSTSSSIQFEVYGDEKLLFKGPVMHINDTAIPVDVSMNGVNELKLIVNDAGDGKNWDHANWADAKLVPHVSTPYFTSIPYARPCSHTCRICGNVKNNKSYTTREMMFGFRDTFEYYKCDRCGCLQIAHYPDNLSKYYPENYYSFEKPDTTKKNFIVSYLRKQRGMYQLYNKSFIGWLLSLRNEMPEYYEWLKYCGVGFDDEILDVGCGNGERIIHMYQEGFTHLTGIDPYIEKDLINNNHIKILKKFVFDLNHEYDFVMLNHALEHMPDQVKTIKKLFEIVKHGHYVLIRIPIVSSYSWRQYGVNWVHLDPPRHLYLHSIESMKILAEKSGFKIKKVVFDSHIEQFLGSMQYMNDIPMCSKRSCYNNLENSGLSNTQIQELIRKVHELNNNKDGDRANFFLYKE